MLLCDGGEEELVRVTRCTQRHYNNLYDDDTILDGFASILQLRSDIKKANLDLKEGTFVTIVEFARLHGELTDAV